MNKIEYKSFSVTISTGKRTYICKTTEYEFYPEVWSVILQYAGIGKEVYTHCYYCCKPAHVKQLQYCNNEKRDYICDTCLVNSIRSIYYNMTENASSHIVRKTIIKKIVTTSPYIRSDTGVLTPLEIIQNVDYMLESIHLDAYKSPKKIFEPNCGQGYFMVALFDKFNEGLKPVILDDCERHRVIIEECLFYSGVSSIDTFITTELLRYHSKHLLTKTSSVPVYAFNYYIMSNENETFKKWKDICFDYVIGNEIYSGVVYK
jgi:hypothetical protein